MLYFVVSEGFYRKSITNRKSNDWITPLKDKILSFDPEGSIHCLFSVIQRESSNPSVDPHDVHDYSLVKTDLSEFQLEKIKGIVSATEVSNDTAEFIKKFQKDEE